MATQRLSNIELCRLVSILLVMILHTTYQSLGTNVNLGVQMVEGFTLIGVNVFVLITGYFSATPKKTSLLNLAFICFFWQLVKVSCRYVFHEPLGYKYAFFITSSNWFIASYIGLLFMTPILNAFCNTSNKKSLYVVVIALITIEIWFDWLPPFPESRIGTKGGYSILSFAILYLLARTIRLYGIPEWFKRFSPLIYIVCSVLAGLMIHFGMIGLTMSYINPVLILSSVAFLMMFERLDFQSTFINHIAKSTLACLLGHGAIFFLYTKQFKYLYNNFTGIDLIVYWIIAIAVVFVLSILIDQLRLLMWKPFNGWLKKHIKDNII